MQTRTSPFPEEEKLLEKANLRYLKTLKIKLLNTKPCSNVKYFPCSKYMMIYRPDLYNLQTRKKQLKSNKELKLTLLSIPTIKNLQYQRWPYI